MIPKSPRERTTLFEPGLEYSFIPTQGDFNFLFIAVERLPKEKPTEMLDRFQNVLLEFGAALFIHWVFGGFHLERARTERAAIQHWFKDHNFQAPIWICGDGNGNPKMTGIQALAVIQKSPRMGLWLCSNGSAYNRSFADAHATYALWAGNPKFPKQLITDDRDGVTTQIFEAAEATYKPVKEEFYSHVTRTWIYLDRLLKWYPKFNKIRTALFKKRGLFEKQCIPSSTGIGAANISGNPMSLTTLSVIPRSDKVTVEPVNSPLQNAADDYKSSFSRAHLVTHPNFRWLLISGTASILPDGSTAHVGDIDGQIDLTMRVVKAILDEQGMTWFDVARAIIYVKDMDYIKNYVQWTQQNDIPAFPGSCVHSAVCRDDLLFEIELDAVQAL